MADCLSCGEVNPGRARFCLNCGAPLAAAVIRGQERKLISVLFVDIVGSTARAHGADPEDVRELLRSFHEPVRLQVERYGGVVEKFIGDAAVAVFGAPLAHGDDSARAVLCAFGIVGEVAAMNVERPGLDLAIRAGVATGEAVVELGSAAGEPLAMGDVLNTAARLQVAAPPGGVLVSATTWAASRRAIQYQAMPALVAKGKPEPLEVWLAVSSGATPEHLDASPLLGRDAELSSIMGAVRGMTDAQKPAFIVVTGEPGVGKSRLAAECAHRASEAGVRVLRGRCQPFTERRAYQATAEQLREAAGVSESDPPSHAREKLQSMVHQCLPGPDEQFITRALSLVIGLGLDEPIEAQPLLFFAVRRLWQVLSMTQPLMLVVDDVQWADDSELSLLDHLAERLSDAAVLYLVLSRPEAAAAMAGWTAPSTLPPIALEPLDNHSAEAMVQGLLGPNPDPEQVRQYVASSGGNPLFLEELAAAAREGHGASLPGTIREALASRIDGLPAAERALLVDASVAGDTFWRGPLLAGREAEVDRLLASLVARGLIIAAAESRLAGDYQYSFKHVLVRDTAYSTLTRPARRERHAAVAGHLELALGGEARDLDTLLAHHWREAGETRRAVEYLLLAAGRAGDAWARAAALDLYAAAVEVAADDQALCTSVRLRRGRTLIQLSDFAAGSAEIDEILPGLTGQDRAEAVLARAWSAYWLEDTDAAISYAALGRELADELAIPELIGPAIVNQAFAFEVAGQIDRVRELYEEANRVWVPGTRDLEYAALHEAWGDVLYWTGDYRGAERLASRAFELGGSSHSVQATLRGGGWRGLSMAAQGHSEAALDWLGLTFKQAQDLDPKWGAAMLNYGSLAYRDMQMFKEARAANEAALEIVAQRGAWGMAEMQASIDVMFTDLAEGDYGRVQTGFDALWKAALGGKAWRPWLGGSRLALVRAQLAAETGNPAELAEFAQDALDRARRAQRPKYEAAARALLGEALLRLGQHDAGLTEFRTAIASADRLGSPTARWQLRASLAHWLYKGGDDNAASELQKEALRVVAAYAEGLNEDHRAHFLGSVEVQAISRGEF